MQNDNSIESSVRRTGVVADGARSQFVIVLSV